ncbi:MAG: hypothetical protein CFH06_00340 [Alphaproteobacteria bacterium MarineAlpha3_Bin5]|nr:MAG: hypothetical protein CFH06_00340 [Alphaproteobacteria bacterium MarineAlpha3_Bin5]
MTDTKKLTNSLLEAIVEAFNSKDIDRIVSHFKKDGEMILAAGPGRFGTKLKGHDEIRDGLKKRFESIPDIKWTEGEHWISDNRGVSRWRVTGTPVAGGILDSVGCDLWEFEGEKILRKDTYYKQ